MIHVPGNSGYGKLGLKQTRRVLDENPAFAISFCLSCVSVRVRQ
jgi:hypothetical protein